MLKIRQIPFDGACQHFELLTQDTHGNEKCGRKREGEFPLRAFLPISFPFLRLLHDVASQRRKQHGGNGGQV